MCSHEDAGVARDDIAINIIRARSLKLFSEVEICSR